MSHDVSFRAWRGHDLAAGTHAGTVADGELRLGTPAGTRRFRDPHGADAARDYVWGAWLAPAVFPGHRFRSLVPSWNAATPQDCWLEVEARTSTDGVGWSRWYTLARWAETSREIWPSSLPGQADGHATVLTDELSAAEGVTWTAFQLRVALFRPSASTTVPSVRLVGALVSGDPGPDRGGVRPGSGTGGVAHGVELRVPAYSQQVHRGEYPQWGGGGEAWCSPASTAMLLRSWGLGPDEQDYAWVDPAYPDRFVAHAVRDVFDHAYGGTGNWSFNVAYAARFGTESFVTRLRSLAEAEQLVAAGVPLVASVSFTAEQLDGAGYATKGHLLAVVGFTAGGDVICHDPASHQLPSNDEVRVVYDRAQFERAWRRSSDGLVYVVRPPSVALPPPPVPEQPNW